MSTKPSEASLIAQIDALKEEVHKAKAEFDKVLRNADRRFEEEKRLRKQWNVERRDLVDDKTRAEALYEASVLETRRLQGLLSTHENRASADLEVIRHRDREIAHLKDVISKYREKIVTDIESDASTSALPCKFTTQYIVYIVVQF